MLFFPSLSNEIILLKILLDMSPLSSSSSTPVIAGLGKGCAERVRDQSPPARAQRVPMLECSLAHKKIADLPWKPNEIIFSGSPYPVFGIIVSFAYELEDGSDKVIVATTHPETILKLVGERHNDTEHRVWTRKND
jgi:hypothetical protein